MKVFISWSGHRSLAVAKALYDWLPRVIQACDPWMSDSDADKGIRWMQTIGAKLEQYNFGIFCLTPENLNSRWINFEAGAISKAVEKSYVWTYLLDLKYTNIEGPLSQFNHTLAEKEDTKKLIRTMNRALGEQARKVGIVDDTFDTFWPRLQDSLNNLPTSAEEGVPIRKTEDMVEEILISVRALLEERTKNNKLADNFILSLFPQMRAAALKDPNFKLTPELSKAMQDLESDAKRNQFKNWLKIYAPDPSAQALMNEFWNFMNSSKNTIMKKHNLVQMREIDENSYS